MIIFKAFQGLENLYIKFQVFPYFSRICTNPVKRYVSSLCLSYQKCSQPWQTPKYCY